MRLYLIRHGRTLPTGPDARAWPLSDAGEREAARLATAPFWAAVGALYSSPEGKALSTVRPAAVRYGLSTTEHERLREVGRPAVWVEEYEAAVEAYLEEDGMPEGWEPREDARRRMAGCVREIADLHPNESVALCGHGLALSLYLSTLVNVPGRLFAAWRSIGFGQVAVVEHGRLAVPFGDPLELGG